MNKYQEALNRILDDDYDFPHDFYGEDKATTKECDANIMQELVDKATLKKPNIWGDGYDDKDSKRVYVTEVVADSVQFLESKSAAASNANSNAYVPDYEQGSNQGYQEPYETSSTLDIASDGLPF